jgi:UPF0271 protein
MLADHNKRISVDINCDLGEGNSRLDCDKDQQLMAYISRCNIACGGHAGNSETMQISIANAKLSDLKIGAHPGYPDRENFGRKIMNLSNQRLLDSICEQISHLEEIAQKLDSTLSHIKLHGALYNYAEQNHKLAQAIVKLVSERFPGMRLLALTGGEIIKSCLYFDHPFIREGFMDRRYKDNGFLASRTEPGAVLNEKKKILEQATALAKAEPVTTATGRQIVCHVDSICLHGDTKNAKEIIQYIDQDWKTKNILIGSTY